MQINVGVKPSNNTTIKNSIFPITIGIQIRYNFFLKEKDES